MSRGNGVDLTEIGAGDDFKPRPAREGEFTKEAVSRQRP